MKEKQVLTIEDESGHQAGTTPEDAFLCVPGVMYDRRIPEGRLIVAFGARPILEARCEKGRVTAARFFPYAFLALAHAEIKIGSGIPKTFAPSDFEEMEKKAGVSEADYRKLLPATDRRLEPLPEPVPFVEWSAGAADMLGRLAQAKCFNFTHFWNCALEDLAGDIAHGGSGKVGDNRMNTLARTLLRMLASGAGAEGEEILRTEKHEYRLLRLYAHDEAPQYRLAMLSGSGRSPVPLLPFWITEEDDVVLDPSKAQFFSVGAPVSAPWFVDECGRTTLSELIGVIEESEEAAFSEKALEHRKRAGFWFCFCGEQERLNPGSVVRALLKLYPWLRKLSPMREGLVTSLAAAGAAASAAALKLEEGEAN